MKHLTRILVVVAVALLAAFVVRATGAPEENQAKAHKTEMDAEAKALLPDLMSSLGGTLTGMQARFYERSGFGIWDYQASGSISRPTGTMTTALDATEATLTRHDYEVTRDQEEKRVTGTKGVVTVIVQAGLLSDDATVSSLQVSLGTNDTASNHDDYAENAAPEDYLAYLE